MFFPINLISIYLAAVYRRDIPWRGPSWGNRWAALFQSSPGPRAKLCMLVCLFVLTTFISLNQFGELSLWWLWATPDIWLWGLAEDEIKPVQGQTRVTPTFTSHLTDKWRSSQTPIWWASLKITQLRQSSLKQVLAKKKKKQLNGKQIETNRMAPPELLSHFSHYIITINIHVNSFINKYAQKHKVDISALSPRWKCNWNVLHKASQSFSLPAADRASTEKKQHAHSKHFILAARGLPLIDTSYIYPVHTLKVKGHGDAQQLHPDPTCQTSCLPHSRVSRGKREYTGWARILIPWKKLDVDSK